MTLDDEQRQLAAVHDDLLREFAGRLGREAVSARFAAIVARFDGAPIRTYVPVLASRQGRQELGTS